MISIPPIDLASLIMTVVFNISVWSNTQCESISGEPLIRADHYYSLTVDSDPGTHPLQYCHVDGFDPDSGNWTELAKTTDKMQLSFLSDKDYSRIRILCAKTEPDPGAEVSFSLAPEMFDHSILYVSSTGGSDSNNGTLQHPFRTLRKALKMKPRTLLLNRGDTFYEHLDISGIDIGAYGTGPKPVLSGVRAIKKEAWVQGTIDARGRWKPSRNGKIWRCHLADPDITAGGGIINGPDFRNNIGSLVDIEADTLITCCRVGNPSRLLHDYDFWQNVATAADIRNRNCYDYLYVYYSGDLRSLGNLGVTLGVIGLQASDANVDNIAIRFWGHHGIEGGSNLHVGNCDIYGIGGMLWGFTYGGDGAVGIGNGVEFYVKIPAVENSLVEDCTVECCYDSGLTIQGESKGTIRPRNVVFRNNEVRNCCQSLEEFLRGDSISDFVECYFLANRCYDGGIRTGFRYDDGRQKYCQVHHNSHTRNVHVTYKDNIFVDGNFLYSGEPKSFRYTPGIWDGNICFIRPGQYIYMNNCYLDREPLIIRYPSKASPGMTLEETVAEAIRAYRSATGDITTRFLPMQP